MLEKKRQKEGKRHERAEVADEIKQHIKHVDVAADKPQNVYLINTVKGNEVDKPSDIMLASVMDLDVVIEKIPVSTKGRVHEGKREYEVEIEREEQIERVAHAPEIVCSTGIKECAAVDQQTDKHEQKRSRNGMEGDRKVDACQYFQYGK